MTKPADTGLVETAPAAVPEAGSAAPKKQDKPRGLWADAWYELRRRPMFLVSMGIIAVLVVMALFPQLFTSVDPNVQDLSKARHGPSAEAWFGYDTLGRDIHARCTSVILATLNPATAAPDPVRIVTLVILSISLLSWPMAMRIMRSAAISARQQDYVKAARALGASPTRIIFRHMLPNCLAPVTVYATI